jgi:hypothetical protein
MKTTIFLLAIAGLTVLPLEAQSRKELRKQKAAEEFAATLELVETGRFRFNAIRAHPTGTRSLDISNQLAFAEVTDSLARADLPFFGTAGNVGYSAESGGIKFEGEMRGVNLSVNENRQRMTLSFSVKSGRDLYNCVFNISGRNAASLGITSNLRSQISYDGRLSPVED